MDGSLTTWNSMNDHPKVTGKGETVNDSRFGVISPSAPKGNAVKDFCTMGLRARHGISPLDGLGGPSYRLLT